jgi:hypothetical protein
MTTKRSRKFPPNEHNTLTREIIETACQKTGLSRKPLMLALVPFGINYNTTHGVFYCVIRGSQDFTDDLVKAVGALVDGFTPHAPDNDKILKLQAKEKAAHRELRKMRRAIERMCVACAAPDKGETPQCWDGTCPLRAISPLPLAKGA